MTLEIVAHRSHVTLRSGVSSLVLWQFTKHAVPKEDRFFLASWLVKLFAGEKDPFVRNAIVTVFGNRKELAASNVIASVLDDDTLAKAALECLGQLRAHQHLAAIKKFVRHADPEIRRAARKTLRKLGCPVEAPPPPVHLLKNRASLPKELEEWSANLDIEQVSPTLEKLSRCIDRGFGEHELAEVMGVIDVMKNDQTKAFRFPIVTRGKTSDLWLEIFMDDIDSPDIAIHATSELIEGL